MRDIFEFHLGSKTCVLIGIAGLLPILFGVNNKGWQLLLIVILSTLLVKGYQLQHKLDTHDLTGLLSRSKLTRELQQIYNDRRRKIRASLLFIDLDQFKEINDEIGHMDANDILCYVAEEVRRNVYGKDLVANFGGDEIVVVLRDTPTKNEILAVAERIRHAVENLINCHAVANLSFSVTVSIGAIALRNRRIKSVRDALQCADQCMQHAKELGRNCTVYLTDAGTFQEFSFTNTKSK